MLKLLKYSAFQLTLVSIALASMTLVVYGIGGEDDCVANVKCPSGCTYNYIQCYTSGCDDSDCTENPGATCWESWVDCECHSPIPSWIGGRCGYQQQ